MNWTWLKSIGLLSIPIQLRSSCLKLILVDLNLTRTDLSRDRDGLVENVLNKLKPIPTGTDSTEAGLLEADPSIKIRFQSHKCICFAIKFQEQEENVINSRQKAT